MKPDRFQLLLFVMLTITLSIVIFLVRTMDLYSLLQNVLINFLCGLIGSFLFILFLLYFLRPKFEISPYICYLNKQYRLKIVNRSIYDAFDISCELVRLEPYHHENGKSSVKIYSINLLTQDMTHIVRYRKKTTDRHPYHLFARTIVAEDLLEESLNAPQSYLELKITVRHGLTGLARTFSQKFEKNCIKQDHKFKFGRNLETIHKDIV